VESAAVTAPVRVAFVAPYAQLGGSERYLRFLLETLGPEWVGDVVVLQEGPLVAELEALVKRPPLVVPTGPGARDIVRAARALRREVFRPGHDNEVVHANGLKAALVCVLATRRIPVVWVKHDFSWDGRLANLVARFCNTVVGVSRAVVETLPATRRVEVVHTGMPETSVDETAARRHVLDVVGAGDDDSIVLLVGRIHPAKGQVELVEAIPRVVETSPHARFVFLGGEDPNTTSYARRVRARVTELGLDGRVSFTGHRDDAHLFVAGADVVVIPSVRDERGMGREGFSLVALEAMMLGTAVVAYDDGALREVLGDCGALVPPGDRGELARAISKVIRDAERRADYERCGRDRVRARFRVDDMVEALRSVYARAAAARR
jgi:glycosyltransferase involved in cell wall biosynthesis